MFFCLRKIVHNYMKRCYLLWGPSFDLIVMNRGSFFWWSRWMKSNAFLRTPQQSSPQTNSRSRWNRRICSFCPRMKLRERERERRGDRTAHGSRCSPPVVKNTRFWCSSTQGRTVLFAPPASHPLKFQQRPDLNSLLGQKRRWILGWSTFHVRSTEWIYWIKCVRDGITWAKSTLQPSRA